MGTKRRDWEERRGFLEEGIKGLALVSTKRRFPATVEDKGCS
jgi:hypothetical protein